MSKYVLRRYLLFVVSLFINAFGIAFITKAMLGTSPITSVTYVLSMFTPLSMGVWTVLINLLFVVIELLFMTREELKADLRIFLLQIPVAFCFGLFIDFSMFVLSWMQPESYIAQIIVLLVGCVILAAGISLEVKANVAMMAGEYLVNVVTRKIHGEFGFVKLGLDVTLLVTACVLSLVFMSGIYGVREGTVIAALLVGPIVHAISPFYRVLDVWITDPSVKKDELSESRNPIITIAREYGSGGRMLGEMLAKESCIIVGRCADFILRDYPKVLKVFCYSDMKNAIARCVNDYGVPQDNAETEIKRINRNRIHHYEYYTGENGESRIIII